MRWIKVNRGDLVILIKIAPPLLLSVNLECGWGMGQTSPKPGDREECCCGFWLLFRFHCWFLSPISSWPLCGSQVSTAMWLFSLLIISSRFLPFCSEPRKCPISSSQPCLHLHPRFLPSLEPFSFGAVQTSFWQHPGAGSSICIFLKAELGDSGWQDALNAGTLMVSLNRWGK